MKTFVGLLVAVLLCAFVPKSSADDNADQKSRSLVRVFLEADATTTKFRSDNSKMGGQVGAGVSVWDFTIGGDMNFQDFQMQGNPQKASLRTTSIYLGVALPLGDDFSIGVNAGTSSSSVSSDGTSIDMGRGKFVEGVMVLGNSLGVRASMRHYVDSDSPLKDVVILGIRYSF